MSRFVLPALDPVPPGWKRLNDHAIEREARFEGAKVAVWKTARGAYRATASADGFGSQEEAVAAAGTLFGAKTDQCVVDQIADEFVKSGWTGSRIDAERMAKLAIRVLRKPVKEECVS